MDVYLPRIADRIVSDSLKSFGAVILQGPRAVGKTTSGLHAAASSVRLDESPDLVTLGTISPETLLAGPTPRLIDEWQLAPTLWNAVRHEVDRRGTPGQFILTGSATPVDDMTRHTGAGRFRRITLRPMTLSESGDSIGAVRLTDLFQGTSVAGLGGPTVHEYSELIVRGGWPALVRQPTRSAGDYLTSYLEDIARVDLPASDLRVDPLRMLALVRALARNVATEISASKLGAEAEIEQGGESVQGVSAQSARKYLDALSRVFVVEEQPAWSPHLRSKVRVRVQPKWHFIDPSLAAAALYASPNSLMADLNTLGLLFESLCVRDLRVLADALGGKVYHYRDESGLEVDIIIELGDGSWSAFEVKLGGAEHLDSAAANLMKLRAKVSPKRAEQLRSLNIITAGKVSSARPDGVNVIALGHLAPG